MFKKILLAYDASVSARRAGELASRMARDQTPPADVYIVTVMDDVPRELGEPYLSQVIKQRTEAGQQILTEAAEILGDDLPLHHELLFGSPAERIIDVARTRACDLIVMGARGLGLLEGLLLGSQVNKVIMLAHCPVLVVK